MRMHTLRKLAVAAACCLAALGVFAPAASAEPRTSPPVPAAPPSFLVLTLRDAHTGYLFSLAYLSCQPIWGSHPNPWRTCSSLQVNEGDLTRLGADWSKVCLLIDEPVLAEAYGFWGTRPIFYSKRFSNRCIAETETNNLFEI